MVKGIYDADLNIQLQNVVAFRKILSKERNPPIEDVIRLNIVPRFVEIVAGYPNVPPEVKFFLIFSLARLWKSFSLRLPGC